MEVSVSPLNAEDTWAPRKAKTLRAAGKSWRAQGGSLPRKEGRPISP